MTAITSACPCCGTVTERETYDIGSGPELSCADCEWCWGAEGQPLRQLSIEFDSDDRSARGDGGWSTRLVDVDSPELHSERPATAAGQPGDEPIDLDPAEH